MEYELPNGDGRTTKFSGEQLAHESSRRAADQLRWTELTIYRTDGGNYVVHKVGRSVVYHRGGEVCTSGEQVRSSDWTDDALPCPKCQPDKLTSAHGWTRESDRHTVHVSTSAEGAVESCYTEDDQGAVYLTQAARQALMTASRRDTAIADAFAVQRVE